MSLGDLPAVILDVVVACAGEEHGWRLEVASHSLRATSMECAAVRLGKCLRMGDGRNAEFAPSWRHVAVALRRGPYYVLRPGNGQTHLKFPTLHACRVPRHEADTFLVAPTEDGEGIVELINGDEDQWKYVGERTTERLAILEIDGFNEPFLQVDEDGIVGSGGYYIGSHTSFPFAVAAWTMVVFVVFWELGARRISRTTRGSPRPRTTSAGGACDDLLSPYTARAAPAPAARPRAGRPGPTQGGPVASDHS